MTNTAPEPDPHARERATDAAVAVDAAAVADGGDRSAPGRGECVLQATPECDDRCALPDAGVALSSARLAPSSGLDERVRRLRVASAVQLELVSGRERPGPEVVWASLPERTREAVLVLLARLIGAGAVEQEDVV